MFPAILYVPSFTDAKDATQTAIREKYGKQEAAAIELDCDPAQFSRELNVLAKGLAKLSALGVLEEIAERLRGGKSQVKATLDSHERRISDLERKLA
jgi:hypothetical protein